MTEEERAAAYRDQVQRGLAAQQARARALTGDAEARADLQARWAAVLSPLGQGPGPQGARGRFSSQQGAR